MERRWNNLEFLPTRFFTAGPDRLPDISFSADRARVEADGRNPLMKRPACGDLSPRCYRHQEQAETGKKNKCFHKTTLFCS
jgi:hypothetical protein